MNITMRLVTLFFTACAFSTAAAWQITWTGTGPGNSWATTSNWNPATPPGIAEIAQFTDAGAAILPGLVTNTLDMDRTISALIYGNSAGNFHTSDLAGFDLTVTGDVDINANQPGPSSTTIRNGTLTVTNPFAAFNVGRSLGIASSGTANLSGLSDFTANISELHVGSGGTNATGELSTPDVTSITADEAAIGDRGRGTWRLRGATTLQANRMKVGVGLGTGLVEMLSPGNVTLGSALQPMELIVGKSAGNNSATLTSSVNLTGATLDAHLSSLFVGQKDDSTGIVNASFIAGNGGSVVVGTDCNTAQIIVGDTRATGMVDLGRVDTFSANLDIMKIGAGLGGNGTVTLGRTTTLDARRVIVGDQATGSLRLGDSNALLIDELMVGIGAGQGVLDGPPAIVVNLGSSSRPTEVSVASGTFNLNSTMVSRIDFSNATVNAHLQSLIVGKKDLLNGKQSGTFLGGNSGSITIGSAAAPGSLIVGDTHADGFVDLSSMDEFSADLSEFSVGVGLEAFGTLRLPDLASITASIITFGNNSDASVHLGKDVTILADEFHVARNHSNATVNIKSGGAVTLGAPDRLIELTVAKAASNTNSTLTGTLDLSMTHLTAYLSSLNVAHKDLLPGRHVGNFFGGNSGSMFLGTPSARGNLIVGQDHANGTLDLSGMDSFTAYLNEARIGVGGSASGDVRLPATNTIDATILTVGNNSDATLSFGSNNVVLIDELHIARDHSNATVDLRAGGTLQLGSPTRRTFMTVAKQNTNTNSTLVGTFNMSPGTLQAYFSQIILGEKNPLPGGAAAMFSIGNSPGNYVDAESIVMAGSQTAATIQFGGGTFVAGSITRGGGTATFNWTGGRFQVGTFGAATNLFTLPNQGTGTLAPGPDAGITHIFGDYVQGVLATTEIELGGLTPGTQFDHITISGRATLAGTLDVTTVGGYVPLPGTTYDFLQFVTRTGVYGNVQNSTPLAGLMFDVTYATNRATINVSGVPGDANLDGLVSGADYTVWADHFDTGASWLDGDFNGDQLVTGADYTIWADHFGESVQPGLASVPEPSTWALCSVSALASALSLRRLRRACVPERPAVPAVQ